MFTSFADAMRRTPKALDDPQAYRRLADEAARFVTVASAAAAAAGVSWRAHGLLVGAFGERIGSDLEFLGIDVDLIRDALDRDGDPVACTPGKAPEILAAQLGMCDPDRVEQLRSFPSPPMSLDEAALHMVRALAYRETYDAARAARYRDWLRHFHRVVEDRHCSIPEVCDDTGRLLGWVDLEQITPHTIKGILDEDGQAIIDGSKFEMRTRHRFDPGDCRRILGQIDRRRYDSDFPADDDLRRDMGQNARKSARRPEFNIEETALTFRGLAELARIHVPADATQPRPGSLDIGELLSWPPMLAHPTQDRIDFGPDMPHTLWVPGGRRSGKSFVFIRKIVAAFLLRVFHYGIRTNVVFVEPTADEAHRIVWKPLAEKGGHTFIPDALLDQDGETAARNNSKRFLRFRDGSEIRVASADARTIEGDGDAPWIVGVDEARFIIRRERAWDRLMTSISGIQAGSGGYVYITGTPDGRNAYSDGFEQAEAKARARELLAEGHRDTAADLVKQYAGERLEEWLDEPDDYLDEAGLRWCTDWKAEFGIKPPASGVASAQEIRKKRATMSLGLWEQEFEAKFSGVEGAVYSVFDYKLHVGRYRDLYSKTAPLLFCLDWNRKPGVAVVAQEGRMGGLPGLVVLGEVFIPSDSNTWKVSAALLDAWGDHEGPVHLYGDETGNRLYTTSKETDWQIMQQELGVVYGDRVERMTSGGNPPVPDRVNAMNSLLLSADGKVRLAVDEGAVKLIRDFEGVRADPDGTPAKKQDDDLLEHISTALGYCVAKLFPVDYSAGEPVGRSWS